MTESRPSSHPVHVGLKFSQQMCTIEQQREVWRIADEAGFDHLWDFDHFHPIGGAPLEGPIFDGWSLLAAMAEATKRVRLGNMVTGQDERTVCIGDVYELGEAVVQVSQPRGPCYKIAWRWKRPELLDLVLDNGRHGWYVRVLREGLIEAGQELRLAERPHPEWTVRRAADVYRLRKRMPHEAGELARCGALAADARARLRRAAEGGRVAS